MFRNRPTAANPVRRRLLALAAGAPTVLAMNPARASESALQTRPIPRSGERLPVIGLGTWRTFDVGRDTAERGQLSAVLNAMVAAGARVVDSSPMYGSSEAVVGDLTEALKLRAALFIATKVWTSGRAEGIRQMELSMRRLRVTQLDLMQVHNLVDVATHAKTLAAWKAEERVRYVGITHYNAAAHGELERWLKAGGWDFVQLNYSLRERDAEQRLLDAAAERGVAVIVNRPFSEGGMFSRVRGKTLPPWAAELGIESWAQYFLKWILGHPAVTCVIPGTSSERHMLDNLGAGRGALPDAALRERMAQAFDAL